MRPPFPARDACQMKHSAAILAICAVCLPAQADGPFEPDAARRGELVRLVRQDCGACHGMTLKGGLGLPLTAEALRDKPAESLAATIVYGRPGTAMPPWSRFLNESEAGWIVGRLMAGFPEEGRP